MHIKKLSKILLIGVINKIKTLAEQLKFVKTIKKYQNIIISYVEYINYLCTHFHHVYEIHST